MPYVVPAIMRIIQKEDTPSVGGLDWMICCGWPYTYNMTLAINTTAGAKTVWTAGAVGMQAYQWHHTVAWYDAESPPGNAATFQ